MRLPEGGTLNSHYRFESYRIRYSYVLAKSDKPQFDMGFTAKICNAAIMIVKDQAGTEKRDTGFAPLINLGLDWTFAQTFGLIPAGDALAAPQGRAEDLLIAIYAEPADRLRLCVGYRILYGGANND